LCLSIWHRRHLRDEPPSPWGILLVAKPAAAPRPGAQRSLLVASLGASHASDAALSIDLGGQRFLNFLPGENAVSSPAER
jgi:hypothetical protein